MKTLIIDNGSTLLEKLAKLSPGSEEVVDYGNIPQDLSKYSLILLSGRSKIPVIGNEDMLDAEINLIQTSKVPIVGICFGHELIAHAFGSDIVHLGEQHKGIYEVTVTQHHHMIGGKDTFSVYENHQYGITAVPPELEILARSEKSIAIIKHIHKPVYGLQFHPEHLTDEQFGDEVFLRLFKLLTKESA